MMRRATSMNDSLYVGDRVTYAGDKYSSSRVGTIIDIDYNKIGPFEVEWDSVGGREPARFRYMSSDLRKVAEKKETVMMKGDFVDAFTTDGQMPTLDEMEDALSAITSAMRARQKWIERVRSLVRDAPAGIDVNELVGISGSIDAIERKSSESVETLQRRIRLALGSFVRGEA
jgi:hypothetical protein